MLLHTVYRCHDNIFITLPAELLYVHFIGFFLFPLEFELNHLTFIV